MTDDVKPPTLRVSTCGACPALDVYFWGCKLWMARNPGRLRSVEHYIYAPPPDWCPLRPAGAVLRVKGET